MSGNLYSFYSQFWNPSLEVLSNMESRGVTLDIEYLERKHNLATEKTQELLAKLNNWAYDYCRQTEEELNWNSPAQLSVFLYEYKNMPIPAVIGTASAAKRNNKREQSTSEASLHWLSDNAKSATDRDYLRVLLEAKRNTKLTQFLAKLPEHVSPDGRLRCSIGPNTDTGRLSSRNPNLQQIPTRNDVYGIRKAFAAPKGKLLVVADYSQLEMFVLAHYLRYVLNDDSLANDLQSGDVHTNTAFRIWGEELRKKNVTKENIKEVAKRYRDNAKTVNYAIPYGKTAAGLGAQILDASGAPIGKEAAQEILDAYFEAYPGMGELFETWREEARSTGEVRTLLGRTRPLPRATSSDKWERFAAERRAVNTPVQGSAADIVTAAMLRCNTDLLPGMSQWHNKTLASLGAELILQVHDELIFEVPERNAENAMEEIKKTMENPFEEPLLVQLKVDAEIGRSWGECK